MVACQLAASQHVWFHPRLRVSINLHKQFLLVDGGRVPTQQREILGNLRVSARKGLLGRLIPDKAFKGVIHRQDEYI